MQQLTWDQVNAWRLSQHYLSTRLKRTDFLQAASRICGVQAQLMSAAELALWARTDDLTPQDVESALWQDRTLVKTWAMRGTLHLLVAEELPLYAAARSYHDNRNWDGYFTYYGVSPAEQQAFLEAVPQVLSVIPMTREQLASALATHTKLPHLRDLIVSSNWGSPLKPSAFRGELCFGPSQGPNVTFVSAAQWTGKTQHIEPEAALQEIVRRYLCAYGPASMLEFCRWWWGGSGMVQAKKIFKSLESELEPVEVEGWPAIALRTSLEAIQSAAVSNSIQLVPLFDAYTLGIGRDIEPLLPKQHKLRVYRPQGWITAVVLVNGYLKGVWEYKLQRGKIVVKVELFTSLTHALKRGIQTEADRLSAFLSAPVTLEYTEK